MVDWLRWRCCFGLATCTGGIENDSIKASRMAEIDLVSSGRNENEGFSVLCCVICWAPSNGHAPVSSVAGLKNVDGMYTPGGPSRHDSFPPPWARYLAVAAKLRKMRRWLLVFLLVLLPLQLTWAAVSTYCQHESKSSIRHIGHHIHKHAGSLSGGDGVDSSEVGSLENDCGVCHANCSVAFHSPSQTLRLNAEPVRIVVKATLYLASYQDLPERPQWVSLV